MTGWVTKLTSNERIKAFQDELDRIADERAARNELTGRRVTEGLTRRAEENEKFLRTVGAVALRMNERYQQAKDSTGWPTARDHAASGGTEHGFAFDDNFSNTDWLR